MEAELSLEEKANLVGDNPLAVERELKDARELLFDAQQLNFSRTIIDAKNRRMISDDGRYSLQWKIRTEPNQPISTINQQTSRGCVELMLLTSPDAQTKVKAFMLAQSVRSNLNGKTKPTVATMQQIVDFLESL